MPYTRLSPNRIAATLSANLRNLIRATVQLYALYATI